MRVVRQIRHQLRGPPCVAWPVAPFLSAPRLGSSRAWATGPSLFTVPARGVRLLRSKETYHIATCTFAISFSSLMGTSMSDCKHALVSRAQRIWQGRMDFRSPRSIRSSAAQKCRATLCQLERTEAPKLRTSILRIQSGWHENGAATHHRLTGSRQRHGCVVLTLACLVGPPLPPRAPQLHHRLLPQTSHWPSEKLPL